MLEIAIVATSLAILASMSLRANRRFHQERRLPMQWSLNGAVNWTAPRGIALAFTPLLAVICLGAALISALVAPNSDALLAVMLMAAAFVAVHAFHLWLIERSLRSGR